MTVYRFRQMAAAGAVLALCAGLQACASDPSWPSISKVTDVGNVMTAEERQKAVQDLQKSDSSHDGDAAAAASK
ncbi:MAG: hypothetical protein ACLPPF_17360 [Rhodomicrobium sp.]